MTSAPKHTSAAPETSRRVSWPSPVIGSDEPAGITLTGPADNAEGAVVVVVVVATGPPDATIAAAVVVVGAVVVVVVVVATGAVVVAAGVVEVTAGVLDVVVTPTSTP